MDSLRKIISDAASSNDNASATEAISAKLSEVKAFAEELDNVLRDVHQELSPNIPGPSSVKRIFDTSAASSTEDWNSSLKSSKTSTTEDFKSDEEFVTASECTCTPQSRSSSFHTASECGAASPWWEIDRRSDVEGLVDSPTTLYSELITSSKVSPETSGEGKQVTRSGTDTITSSGKIIREVTETRLFKVSHCHVMGVASLTQTSESLQELHLNANKSQNSSTEVIEPETSKTQNNQSSEEDELLDKIQKSAEWVRVKVLDVEPTLTDLGSNVEEAAELQRAHDEVLLQLQTKQSPVEELLRQADQLIATQRPRAEVYAAMAESLGTTWKSVNNTLDHRKQILDLNVIFQTRLQECNDRIMNLELACHESQEIPVEIEDVKEYIKQIHELRRRMLEGVMVALQEGNALLGSLRDIVNIGTLDSRPDHIKQTASYSVTQVENWLEAMHDRRKAVEISWQTRKNKLEQCLALALLAKDLHELEVVISDRRELLENSYYLGDSESSGNLLLQENEKLQPEAKELQDKALRITRATEQLVLSECYAGESAKEQAYSVLGASSEYIHDLEQREALLSRAIQFFRSGREVLKTLDQLQQKLQQTEIPQLSPKLATLHAHVSETVHELCTPTLQDGYSLLDDAGRGNPGAEGIKHLVEEIENKKIYLDGLCTAHKEDNRQVMEAVNEFYKRYEVMYQWLITIAEAFLQGHQDMGSNLPMSTDFLDLHHQLLKDLEVKGNEINTLLLTLPPILEYLDDEQRVDVDKKVDLLHEHWINIKNILENRLDLATQYEKFHKEAVDLTALFDITEQLLKKTDGNTEEQKYVLEEKWAKIKPMYSQLKATGNKFIQDSPKASSDPYLDISRACLCVETLLEHFASRQFTITEHWESYQTSITVQRDYQVQWEFIMTQSVQTLNWVTKLDNQLYPILNTPTTNANELLKTVEEKLKTVLPEIKEAQAELEERIRTTESLASKDAALNEKTKNVKENLQALHQKLQNITTDYQILLQMLTSFFKNVTELDKTVEKAQAKYTIRQEDLDAALKEHEASKSVILEMFKYTLNESEEVINRIRQQEPIDAAQIDIEKIISLLENRRLTFEASWLERKSQLDHNLQLGQFDADLNDINSTLDDLNRQLSSVRGEYGESLASAKATSLAFEYFEKTIELLQQRIDTFIDSSQQMLVVQPEASQRVRSDLDKLQKRWNEFRRNVAEIRRLIDLSIEYFNLVDEADELFREGSKVLVTIARKAAAVKTPEDATQLLQEVEIFIKPGEIQQEERIKKISALAVQLYGYDRSKQLTQVLVENQEMIESFTIISTELTTLVQNLKTASLEREDLKRKQDEVDQSLAEAKAEALIAKSAALAAEEAQRAAEAAAKALREAPPLIHRIEVQHIQTVQTISSDVETLPEEIKEEIPVIEEVPVVIEEQPMVVEEMIVESAPIIEELPDLEAPEFTLPLNDATIQEGGRFTFECRVTGKPTPDIEWYKDGISIQNNLDYKTTYDDELCTLTIEETFTEDSATFTCKATNSEGTAETHASLSVRETDVDELLLPPTFTKHLESNRAQEGGTFQFECSVTGNPLPTVQWYKNDLCIDNSPDYVINYNNGDAVLKFEQVFLEDNATYLCRASNQLGSDETVANLTVEPLEPTEIPSFRTPLSNIMGRAGSKIKLECEVTGIPRPEVSWMQNGKPFKETRDSRLHYEDERASLVISEAFPKDAGLYVISARNIAGEASSACNVFVKGRLPNETSDSELASDMEPIKPSVQLALKDQSVFEGKRVRFDCIIVGQPEPEVIWYHDDRPVKESTDFQLLFQGDRCSLIIIEAYAEDAGEYKVVAINSAGEASSKCRLAITQVNDSEPATRTPAAPKEAAVGAPPKFEKLLTDILAAENDKVVFECSVTGDPRPDIKIFRNNEEVTLSERINFGYSEEGVVSLVINNAQPDDKGVYTVKAFNSSGEAKCFSQLIVKSVNASEQKPTVQTEEKLTAPAFKELFCDRNVYESESTKFECIVTGKPVPKVKWLFNGAPVSGKDFLVSTSGERQVLTIPSVSKDHCGSVSCVAENEIGKATCVAVLSTIPSDFSNRPEFNTTLIQNTSDSSSFSIKKEVIVQSSTHSNIIVNGGPPQTEVHSITSQSENSSKQINNEPALITQKQHTEEFHQINKEPPIIHEKTVSNTIVNNESNIHETVSAVVQPVQVFKQIRKSMSPRFVTPLVGKIVDQGSDLILEGIVDGFPAPEVKWMKNNEELQLKGAVKSITYELNKAKIELQNVSVKDAGRYTCTATNSAGTASSTADLVVKKTIFPPVFGRRLQAQVVKKNDRVIMEVEVTGTPEPTVTWHKDNKPIAEAMVNEYRLKTQGNCHTLIIDNVSLGDSGKYMVRAVNAGGEAQSIADFAVFEPTPDMMVEVVKTMVFEDVREQDTQKPVTHLKPSIPSQQAQELLSSLSSNATSSQTESSSHTESVIVTETRNTEQTFKLEHKTSMSTVSDLPLPILTSTSSQNESPITQQTQTTTVRTFEKKSETEPKISSCTNTEQQESLDKSVATDKVEHAPPVATQTSVQNVDEGIQTSSITKKSALDFFVSKLKDTEEQHTASKHAPLHGEYEDKVPVIHRPCIKKVAPPHYTPDEEIPDPYIAECPCPGEYQPPPKPPQQSLLEDFGLEPGPPPEMGYMPKSETVTQKEDVAFKIKRLQENHKEVAPPSGGVKMFDIPTQLPKEETTLYAPSTTGVTHKTFSETSYTKYETQTPVQPAQVTAPPCEIVYKQEPLTFTPLQETKDLITKSVTSEFSKSSFYSTSDSTSSALPIYRPTGDIELRPTSPRPSAEGLEMEKLWTRPQSPKPRPSSHTEYATLEKQWTPKTPEPELRPFSSLSTASDKLPSAQGVAMDKIWAHKRPDSALKTQWPPQPEDEKTLGWSAHGIVEKQWPPVTTSHEVVKETFQTSQTNTGTVAPEAPHYVSHTVLSESSDISKSLVSESITSESKFISHEVKTEIDEQTNIKPSELKQWPPNLKDLDEYALKAPQLVKQSLPKFEAPKKEINVQDIMAELNLEPGPPPEMCFAPKLQRKTSYVETIEQDLEKTLDREPSKVLPGAVRTIPPSPQREIAPPLPPKDAYSTAPPVPSRPSKPTASEKPVVESKPFERFPDLEPFPFKPDTEKPKTPVYPPPTTPSKFIKGDFTESDYESELELSKFKPKWTPGESPVEMLGYRKVNPPSTTPVFRSKSTDPEPLPPSKFEHPLPIKPVARPFVETTSNIQKLSKTSKFESFSQKPAPVLTPGPPPQFIEAEKKVKPESPKTKPKFQPESGYMADTDEPFRHLKKSIKSESSHFETKSHSFEHTSSSSFTSNFDKVSTPVAPAKHYRHHVHKSEKPAPFEDKSKELSSTSMVKNISMTSKQIKINEQLEPFPYSPEPPAPRRVAAPPPPSPSKFIKGEFHASDYESDFDGRIPSVWKPNEPEHDRSYKPVRPVFASPSGRYSRTSESGKSPLPPSEFETLSTDFGGPPKFSPIEKPDQAVKLNDILTTKSQHLYKPKPLAPKPITKHIDIVATPAVRDIVLQPGSPPEMGYIPPPKQTRYYTGIAGVPLTNAIGTETSNTMHFNESTENSHRVVNITQTTRVIKFGENKTEQKTQQYSSTPEKRTTHTKVQNVSESSQQHKQNLEPFPFRAEPERPKRAGGPPPPKPKKFIPGEFKESDYDSEVESGRIRPKWAPPDSDGEEPYYRKVQPPNFTRSSSLPRSYGRVMTPMEFDTQPPVMPTEISKTLDYSQESRKSQHVDKTSTEYYRKIFNKSNIQETSRKSLNKTQGYKSFDEMDLQPGSPPKYGYVPVKTATHVANQHMQDMTTSFKSKAQQFVTDLMTDVKTPRSVPQKPILKHSVSENESDAHAYREESRVAQYGTKHIDPDTGLIYFKYDFGYEFGIIFPGEGKKIVGGSSGSNSNIKPIQPKRDGDINVPIIHEKSKKITNGGSYNTLPSRLTPNYLSGGKNVKWEPTSESEMSDFEDFRNKKRFSLPSNDQTTPSPMSLSPSLPSISPRFNARNQSGHESLDRPRSTTPSTPGSAKNFAVNSAPVKPPTFITPLRDIAVVSGQPARFECIVQSEPQPGILWSKNGRILENSSNHQIHFRNGVCRLTIPQAFPEDAGSYTCTATNSAGAVGSAATLQVPGERRCSYLRK